LSYADKEERVTERTGTHLSSSFMTGVSIRKVKPVKVTGQPNSFTVPMSTTNNKLVSLSVTPSELKETANWASKRRDSETMPKSNLRAGAKRNSCIYGNEEPQPKSKTLIVDHTEIYTKINMKQKIGDVVATLTTGSEKQAITINRDLPKYQKIGRRLHFKRKGSSKPKVRPGSLAKENIPKSHSKEVLISEYPVNFVRRSNDDADVLRT